MLYILWLWIWSFILTKLFLKYFLHHDWHINEINIETDLKDWLYEKFLKYSIFVFIFQFVVLIISIAFMFFDKWWKSWLSIWLVILQIFLNIIFLLIIIKIFRKILDFENDFTVVVPDKIEFINQSWIFTRAMKSLDSEKIKTIWTNKKWIIRAIFNVWSLTIFSEWDESKSWEVHLKWLYNPEKVQRKIEKIMWKSKEKEETEEEEVTEAIEKIEKNKK